MKRNKKSNASGFSKKQKTSQLPPTFEELETFFQLIGVHDSGSSFEEKMNTLKKLDELN